MKNEMRMEHNRFVQGKKILTGMAVFCLMFFVMLVGNTDIIRAATEAGWSEDGNKYYYTDENGWQYSFNTKEETTCVLTYIPEDVQGEIVIPAELIVDGTARTLKLIENTSTQIPAGVTKVTFEKAIFYYSGVLFDACNPDLLVCCYLDGEDSLPRFAMEKGLKVEYLNAYTDENGVIYYATREEFTDGTRGEIVGAVYGYEGEEPEFTVKSKVTIRGVEYTITNVRMGAFAYTTVKKVTLPNTIIRIGNGAFEGCENLVSVKLSKKLKELGSGAFSGCSSLTSVEIPSGVTSLYTQTFSDCRSLKKVVLSKKTKHLGDYVFSGCKNLKTIKNLEQVESIGSETFSFCEKLTTLKFGKKLKRIGMGAFYNCKGLKSITIQSTSMDFIASQAFYGANKLATLTLKATNLNAKKVESEAFAGCKNKMVIKVPAKKVKAYSKWMKKCGNTTIVVKKA